MKMKRLMTGLLVAAALMAGSFAAPTAQAQHGYGGGHHHHGGGGFGGNYGGGQNFYPGSHAFRYQPSPYRPGFYQSAYWNNAPAPYCPPVYYNNNYRPGGIGIYGPNGGGISVGW